ncbi:MAG: universal stress protein [Prochlorotrichaceae cyanobacterium]|jgi:nucleotide-binding universal stress UspA family protein
MINKILLADSGTGQTEAMLRMLLEIPALKSAKVTLLHAVPPQITPEALSEKWEEGAKILASAIQSTHLDPTNVLTMLRQGDPKDVVCAVADEIETDLIVMGSRGLQKLRAILENSVSQYVFQLSSRPMLLVKDDIFVKRIGRILVAIDKSDSTQRCLNLALFLASGLQGGQIVLTHAGSRDAYSNAEDDPVLATAIERVKRAGISYRCFSSTGKPGPILCDVAEETKSDLIILGSPDRRPSIAKNLVDLDRLVGGSTSDYVRINANCPVLLERIPV